MNVRSTEFKPTPQFVHFIQLTLSELIQFPSLFWLWFVWIRTLIFEWLESFRVYVSFVLWNNRLVGNCKEKFSSRKYTFLFHYYMTRKMKKLIFIAVLLNCTCFSFKVYFYLAVSYFSLKPYLKRNRRGFLSWRSEEFLDL